ncbi:FecCD family ABC transporter permease [Paenibacillus radicis (ex Xue et al. 2023)]|uniref:Iron ABC transporter permease n=1 Tax=Paenibacillus radicis (ex Xue et al. 2023) TaxID=2972489 RepID=A0ABT1YPJ1_9BACL|nr:iron ABC transporter permease [Paenibacillus radicis (ex Xue et al. 2023)]MCR8635096.1 iron ABC transporter permease [Paenibacillus radicis (ex Xue et al. 2023)]
MIFHSNLAKLTGFIACLCLTVLLFLASNVYGYTNTTWSTFQDAYIAFNGSNEHVIIRDIRLPRAIVGALVGGALAIAGALMQALTRNPLASPGILGVNAGAGFFIVTGFSVFSLTSQSEFIWMSLLGAAVAAISVYMVSSVGFEGLTPLKLTFAGATMSALFTSFTTAILVTNEGVLDNIFLWLAGSVDGRKLDVILPVLPFISLGFICALFLGQAMNVISVGEDVAKGLGQNTFRVKLFTLLIVVFLAGSSVALAGPIGFIGLVIPHIVRSLVGIDYRWVIPYCALLGACLLLAADISARFVAFPKEVPVGIMTAIIGAPFFIYLARKELKKQ